MREGRRWRGRPGGYLQCTLVGGLPPPLPLPSSPSLPFPTCAATPSITSILFLNEVISSSIDALCISNSACSFSRARTYNGSISITSLPFITSFYPLNHFSSSGVSSSAPISFLCTQSLQITMNGLFLLQFQSCFPPISPFR